jgi:hypothetical protein
VLTLLTTRSLHQHPKLKLLPKKHKLSTIRTYTKDR